MYRFESPDRSVQIVANQENIYAVGDVAAIALAGTTLLDGTKLKRAKLRGVESQGMALGPVEAEVGTDLSEGRCKPEVELAQGRLLKWTSISLLHNVAKDVRARAEIDGSAPPKVRPAFGLTGTWLIPSSWYSTGSSTVTRLMSGDAMCLTAEYSVVDLPEPVGPVTRIMP